MHYAHYAGCCIVKSSATIIKNKNNQTKKIIIVTSLWLEESSATPWLRMTGLKGLLSNLRYKSSASMSTWSSEESPNELKLIEVDE